MNPNFALSAAPHLPFPMRTPVAQNTQQPRHDRAFERKPMIRLANADNADLILKHR